MPAIESDGGHVRLRLDISYDGTEFAGWAPQAGQRTVAGSATQDAHQASQVGDRDGKPSLYRLPQDVEKWMIWHGLRR